NTPIIMVGPGTGVAPFRAYLQEREVTGAKGKNWLFFGAQHESCDFAYGDEFTAYVKQGLLTRLDCAWSRDQAQKVYVQHKMTENAAEIWKWLDAEGAHFFVCGDARRMAKDVDGTLRKIVQEQGGKTVEQANEYVEKLKSDKRYKRDVYKENDETQMTRLSKKRGKAIRHFVGLWHSKPQAFNAMYENTEFTLSRDCEAIQIPSGQKTTTPAGTLGVITQSLGGSYTIATYQGLARVAEKDLDALGLAKPQPQQTQKSAPTDGEVSEEDVWNQLRQCYDPEIPVNI